MRAKKVLNLLFAGGNRLLLIDIMSIIVMKCSTHFTINCNDGKLASSINADIDEAIYQTHRLTWEFYCAFTL